VALSGSERRTKDLSYLCLSGEHQKCSHRQSLISQGGRSYAGLCLCRCHSNCALGGMSKVLRERWIEECSCTGAAEAKHIYRAVEHESGQLKESADHAGGERGVWEANPASRAVVEVVSNLLSAVREQGLATSDYEGVMEPLNEIPSLLALHYAIGLCMGTIKWAIHETGRPEEAILQEIVSDRKPQQRP
jgi:hypothetical protein